MGNLQVSRVYRNMILIPIGDMRRAPPDATTLHVLDGTLKSETVKSGLPDWSGNKHFSLFSW